MKILVDEHRLNFFLAGTITLIHSYIIDYELLGKSPFSYPAFLGNMLFIWGVIELYDAWKRSKEE